MVREYTLYDCDNVVRRLFHRNKKLDMGTGPSKPQNHGRNKFGRDRRAAVGFQSDLCDSDDESSRLHLHAVRHGMRRGRDPFPSGHSCLLSDHKKKYSHFPNEFNPVENRRRLLNRRSRGVRHGQATKPGQSISAYIPRNIEIDPSCILQRQTFAGCDTEEDGVYLETGINNRRMDRPHSPLNVPPRPLQQTVPKEIHRAQSPTNIYDTVINDSPSSVCDTTSRQVVDLDMSLGSSGGSVTSPKQAWDSPRTEDSSDPSTGASSINLISTDFVPAANIESVVHGPVHREGERELCDRTEQPDQHEHSTNPNSSQHELQSNLQRTNPLYNRPLPPTPHQSSMMNLLSEQTGSRSFEANLRSDIEPPYSEMRVRSDSNRVVRDQYTMNHCTVTIIQCSHSEELLDSLSSADSDRIFCYDKYKDREYYKMPHADHRQSKMSYVMVGPRRRY